MNSLTTENRGGRALSIGNQAKKAYLNHIRTPLVDQRSN